MSGVSSPWLRVVAFVVEELADAVEAASAEVALPSASRSRCVLGDNPLRLWLEGPWRDLCFLLLSGRPQVPVCLSQRGLAASQLPLQPPADEYVESHNPLTLPPVRGSIIRP